VPQRAWLGFSSFVGQYAGEHTAGTELMIGPLFIAAGVWFNISMPRLNDVYPNSVGWVVTVLVMGALITVVAAYGYKVVARIANIAAPWMQRPTVPASPIPD
jgi:hypothetical protein